MKCRIFCKSLKRRPIIKAFCVITTIGTTAGLGLASAGIGPLASGITGVVTIGLLASCAGLFGNFVAQIVDNDYVLVKNADEQQKLDLEQRKLRKLDEAVISKSFLSPINDLSDRLNILRDNLEENGIELTLEQRKLLRETGQNISALYTEYISNKDDKYKLLQLITPKTRRIKATLDSLEKSITQLIQNQQERLSAVSDTHAPNHNYLQVPQIIVTRERSGSF